MDGALNLVIGLEVAIAGWVPCLVGVLGEEVAVMLASTFDFFLQFNTINMQDIWQQVKEISTHEIITVEE